MRLHWLSLAIEERDLRRKAFGTFQLTLQKGKHEEH
jgi:hypothetical protein